MNFERNDFDFIDSSRKADKEQVREALTYWADTWRRLKKNKMAIAGLIGVILVTLFALVGPFFTGYDFDEQHTDFANTPLRIEIYEIDDGLYVYLTPAYRLLVVEEDGTFLYRLTQTSLDAINRQFHYDYFGEDVTVDYSYNLDEDLADENINYSIIFRGIENKIPYKVTSNKSYPLGSDNVGRDILTRIMYGARISLEVALFAALFSLLIGVTYGAIAGMAGGRIDNLMMRFVDIVDSIPLLLYVILIMVIIDNKGLGTIILTLGLFYWVGMARLVRGQVLTLKETEYVLAARMLGVSKPVIIWRHLIPNAMGPILVALTMMIPTAVFTESFLSFIGLGISAPLASLGTLCNDSLDAIQTYPFQLLAPALLLAVMMLAFNFLGDGLRSALDPRLRKG
jgi:oligopeptide transport system permease protein